jgi:hypothetical protein
MDFLNHKEGGMVFYQFFLLSPLQSTATVEIHKKLHEFEEIHKRLREFEISRQSCRGESVFFIQVGGVSGKLRAGQAHHEIELHQKLHPLRRQGGHSQVH